MELLDILDLRDRPSTENQAAKWPLDFWFASILDGIRSAGKREKKKGGLHLNPKHTRS